jgi:hypothetical protein
MKSSALTAQTLPTIDDFVAVLQSLRARLAARGATLSAAAQRSALRDSLDDRREAYFAAAADHADLERRQRTWEREHFSSLFNR